MRSNFDDAHRFQQAETLQAVAGGGGGAASVNSDFVRHGDDRRHQHHSNRQLALERVQDRLTEAMKRAPPLMKIIAKQSQVPVLRWQWAIFNVLSGRLLPADVHDLKRFGGRILKRGMERLKLDVEAKQAEEEYEDRKAWADIVGGPADGSSSAHVQDLALQLGMQEELPQDVENASKQQIRQARSRLIVKATAPCLDKKRECKTKIDEANIERVALSAEELGRLRDAISKQAKPDGHPCLNPMRKGLTPDGQPNLPTPCICGVCANLQVLDAMERRGGKLKYPNRLDDMIEKAFQLDDAAKKAEPKLDSLQSYIAVLQEAVPRDKDQDVNVQSSDKFEGLQGLIQGLPAPRCPICLSSACELPLVTPCVHIFCKKCFLAHMAATDVLGGGHGIHGDDVRGKSSKCPLCRRAIRLQDLIEIVPDKKNEDEDADADEEGGGGGERERKRERKGQGGQWWRRRRCWCW